MYSADLLWDGRSCILLFHYHLSIGTPRYTVCPPIIRPLLVRLAHGALGYIFSTVPRSHPHITPTAQCRDTQIALQLTNFRQPVTGYRMRTVPCSDHSNAVRVFLRTSSQMPHRLRIAQTRCFRSWKYTTTVPGTRPLCFIEQLFRVCIYSTRRCKGESALPCAMPRLVTTIVESRGVVHFW